MAAQYNNPFHAFVGNFLDVGTDKIMERKKEARDYEQEQKDLAELNKPKIKKYEAMVTATTALANRLESNYGVTKDMIQAAIAESPSALTNMSKYLAELEGKTDRNWVKNNIEDLVSGTLAVATDIGEQQSLSEMIRSSYGLGGKTVGDYQASDSSFWERGLGINASDRARAKLDKEMATDGYSIYDLNQSIAGAGFESINPGSYVSYLSPKVFTRDEVEGERINYDRIKGELRKQGGFKEAENAWLTTQSNINARDAVLKQIRKKYADGKFTGSDQEYNAEVKELEELMQADREVQLQQTAIMQRFYDSVVSPYLIQQDVTFYGGTYLNNMQDDINLMFPGINLDDMTQRETPIVTNKNNSKTEIKTSTNTEESDGPEILELYSNDGKVIKATVSYTLVGKPRVTMPNGEVLSLSDSERFIAESELNKKNLTNSSSTLDILSNPENYKSEGEKTAAFTLTKEQFSELSLAEKKKYAEDTDGNYSPLGVAVGGFTGSNTFTDEKTLNSMELRRDVDPDKNYIVYTGGNVNSPRIMSGSMLIRLDPSIFENPSSKRMTIVKEATAEELEEHKDYILKQNRPWTLDQFNKSFKAFLK